MVSPLEVTCPYCEAKPAQLCRTANRDIAYDFHAPRRKLAEAAVRTKTGKVLTDDDIKDLADEAERGYDVRHLARPEHLKALKADNKRLKKERKKAKGKKKAKK